MKRILFILLCLSVLMTGCQQAAEETQATTVVPVETVGGTVGNSTESIPGESVPGETTESVVLYRHPLTGEPLDAPFQTKPVCVVINNIKAAQPLHGVGAADIICEIVVEGGGGITRLLGVYTDLESADKVGSIRSARTYFVDLARSFGEAPLIHCGWSTHAQTEITKTGYPSFNQSFNTKYFYRDQERLNKGYSKEHTLFAKSTDLLEGLTANGFDLTVEEGVDYGWQFSENPELQGQDANKITCQFYSENGKKTVMTYNAEEGVYYGKQVWKKGTKKILDANTGESVPFENVLMIFAKTTNDGKHKFVELTGKGTGYYACNGKAVPIQWVREKDTDPFTFCLEDGTPITMGVGKTYLGVLAHCSPDVIIE